MLESTRSYCLNDQDCNVCDVIFRTIWVLPISYYYNYFVCSDWLIDWYVDVCQATNSCGFGWNYGYIFGQEELCSQLWFYRVPMCHCSSIIYTIRLCGKVQNSSHHIRIINSPGWLLNPLVRLPTWGNWNFCSGVRVLVVPHRANLGFGN